MSKHWSAIIRGRISEPHSAGSQRRPIDRNRPAVAVRVVVGRFSFGCGGNGRIPRPIVGAYVRAFRRAMFSFTRMRMAISNSKGEEIHASATAKRVALTRILFRIFYSWFDFVGAERDRNASLTSYLRSRRTEELEACWKR